MFRLTRLKLALVDLASMDVYQQRVMDKMNEFQTQVAALRLAMSMPAHLVSYPGPDMTGWVFYGYESNQLASDGVEIWEFDDTERRSFRPTADL